jgi:hypothetical protein
MAFVKSVLVWATVLTAALICSLVVQDIRAGRQLQASSVLILTIIVWVVMAGLVTFSKIMRGARRFGANLGRAVVKNPKQEAGAAIGGAMDDALRRSGVKAPDSGKKP